MDGWCGMVRVMIDGSHMTGYVNTEHSVGAHVTGYEMHVLFSAECQRVAIRIVWNPRQTIDLTSKTELI